MANIFKAFLKCAHNYTVQVHPVFRVNHRTLLLFINTLGTLANFSTITPNIFKRIPESNSTKMRKSGKKSAKEKRKRNFQ